MNILNKKTEYLTSPSKLRNLLAWGGCWVLIWSQYLMAEGLLGIPATSNAFAVMIGMEILLFFSLAKLISTNIARDLMDLTSYGLLYWLILWIAYELGWDLYISLAPYRVALSRFFFLAFWFRFFWLIKEKNTGIYYSWPIVGVISAFFGRKSAEPIVRSFWHSLFVYLGLIAALTYAIYGIWPPYTSHIKELIGGMVGFVLFFKFFCPYMQANIAMAQENIEHRSKKEQLAALTAAVLTKTEGKLDPELVEIMCMFSEMDESTQSAMAASIRALHQKIVAGEVPSNKNKKPEDE
jgi:hypothetical protein